MIDIHTHILPGIDDGPEAIDESIRIVAKAAAAGIKVIVATPHILEPPTNEYCERILWTANALEAEIIARKIDIKIIASAEFSIFPDLPECVKKHEELIIRYKNNYILLELPVYQIPLYTEDVIYKLLTNRCIPIIAHPERNLEIQQKPEKLQILIQQGAMTQLNAGSLVGIYGKKVQKTAKTLLKKDLIHMMGSDIHSFSSDTYQLVKGVDAAAKIIGRKKAGQLVCY